jgi:hypothetical protein
MVLLNATDPANLFGPALSAVPAPETDPGPEHDPGRFTRIPANYVVLLRGQPVLLLETGGEKLTTRPQLSPETQRQALQLAVKHVGSALGRLSLRQWNGEPVLDSPIAPLLERLGFRREALVYIWE